MPSKTDIIVNGLDLTVYGLEEYNNLPKGTPVGILFAIHGRLQQKAIMEPLAGVVCPLNDTRSDPGQRHLLVVTFDQVNHGSRLVDKNANNGWEAHNPSHAVDMWSMIHTGANTVSELIDVLEHYLFGGQRPVQVWGCMGFSMGGHVAFLAGAQGRKKRASSRM
ncbi:hypothetical protein DM01DRAFT_252777 [Hesseltinella vesiculosa]|uniref:Peptidase S9 prolyl oligopeptidase catalytic domain-containing protein n=1 Tax=Hesseltinella vesiculosa TaxID=101127 RepID=A0A1X2GGT3_9FUNG|nr:hypothetical protein DM01DRAFT_252777 [Hesseltinella vesiculosa]